MDEVAGSVQKSIFAISEIACDLFHPLAVGSRKDPYNIDSSTLEVDDEENEISNQARPRDHFDAEEVGRCNRAPMSLEKRLPRHPLPSDGVKPVLEKNPFDGASRNLMTEIVERSSNAGAAPARVVAGHLGSPKWAVSAYQTSA